MRIYLNLALLIISIIISNAKTNAQTHFISDPNNLLISERQQFDGLIPQQSNIFRPLFFDTDTLQFSFRLLNETYFNDNVPNQENMDIRYFSKGISNFHSIQLSINSPYFSFIFEPYLKVNRFDKTNIISRSGPFSVLNDKLLSNYNSDNNHLRNFLAVFHYKGLGFGWHKGNRWWGPGIHSSLQMSNNTQPMPAQIIGTVQEIKIGKLGLYGLLSISNLNNKKGEEAKYFSSLNGSISWYGSLHLTLGFSRNYLTGGTSIENYVWSKKDAKMILFQGLLTSDLLSNEYSAGGHDIWDQTLSFYLNVTFPKRRLKVYTEMGFNDNRMYFADLLSQPDHSLATIFGIRDYGVGKLNNIIWGFEWTNLMITYSSRHRIGGPGTWYERSLYDYSSYKGRRWGAHSGTDSDDWYFYLGYMSNNLMFVPALNYERHGIVSQRPAEVKIEARFDLRYKFNDLWVGIFFEKQFEAFLGFPGYFYEDSFGNKIDASSGNLANTRKINTIIISISRTLNY